MTISAPSGFPRPLSNGQQNPNNDKAGYQSKAKADMEMKKRKERESQIALWSRDLGEAKVELAAQLNAQTSLKLEMSKLGKKTGLSGPANAWMQVDVKNLERQYKDKVLAKNTELSSLEGDNKKFGLQVQSEQSTLTGLKKELTQKNISLERLLDQKKQIQKNNFQRINMLREEIRLKTLELDGALDTDAKIQQEINKLASSLEQSESLKPEIGKKSGSVLSGQALLKKISENETRIEQLKTEIKIIDQEFETKKRVSDVTNKAVIARGSQTTEQANKAILIANRIKDLQQRVVDLQKRINTLMAVR